MGVLRPLARLRSDAQRHRRLVGAAAREGQTRLDCHHRRFARWFDFDLDEFQRGFGTRRCNSRSRAVARIRSSIISPNDPTFRGTVICSVVPGMCSRPAVPDRNVRKGVEALQDRSPAQRASHYLAMPLEETFAFLKQGGTHARRAAASDSRFPIGRRAGHAGLSALLQPDRPRTARADDRKVRLPANCRTNPQRLAPAVHPATTAELCAEGRFSCSRSGRRWKRA